MAPAPVATWTGQTLSLAQFEAEYARQNGGRTAALDDSLGKLQDFLRRYVDFRLKVREAERLGYGDRPEVRDELDRYVQEYASPYLLDQRVLEPLVREVYDRQGVLIDASHILISAPRTASPADTLAARQRLLAVLDSVDAGMDFGEAARRFSNDPSAQRPNGPGSRGRLGYFTSGTMVEEFEEAAYATPAGQRSPIVRTSFGYHVLYVHDKKAMPPRVQSAHIMIVPADGTPEAKAAARARIDSVQQRLAEGADFAALAQQYSMDSGSASRGGDLGMTNYTDLPVEPFRTIAWAMTTPGQVSDVVETSFGFHLIKHLGREERPSFETAAPQLKSTAARLPRAERLRTNMLRDLARTYRARVDTTFLTSVLAPIPNDSVLVYFSTNRVPAAALDRSVVFLGDSTYTLRQVAQDVMQRGLPTDGKGPHARVVNLTQRFMDEAVNRYAARDLPARDPEFGRLMNDFRDGTLLFKLMEDSVWSRAQNDAAGLRVRYAFRAPALAPMPPRTRLIVFSGAKREQLDAVHAALAGGTPVDSVVATLPALVAADTLLQAGPTGSPLDAALNIPDGTTLGPIAYRNSTWAVVLRSGAVPARPKTYEEALPEIVSEYQRELETGLVERLRRRYQATLYPERLERAFK